MFAVERLGKIVTMRVSPSVWSIPAGWVLPGSKVTYTEIVPDLDTPIYSWLHLSNGRYVNYFYPPAGWRFTLVPITPPVPKTGQLVWVKFDNVARNTFGAPAVYPTLAAAYIKADGTPVGNYTIAMQHLMVPHMTDVSVHGAPGDFTRNMTSLWRSNAAFSNGKPYDGDWRIQGIYTTGACFRAITGIPYWKRLKQWVDVYAIDPEHLPTIPTSAADIDWTLHFHPTTSTRIKYTQPDGKVTIRTDPFGQFDGASIIPFFGAEGIQSVQYKNLLYLPDQTIPNSYNPPR